MANGLGSPLALFRRIAQAMLALLALAFGHSASAQAITTYTNSTAGAINNTTTCTAPLVRNFNVGTSFTA